MRNPPTTALLTKGANHLSRRTLCRWPLAALAAGQGASAMAQAAAGKPPEATPGSDVRLALVMGNRDYPRPHDLPPIHKNVNDVSAALRQRGFDVTSHLDLDTAQAREVINQFIARVQAAPPDAVVFFYFSGHGLQADADNLLVAARVNPATSADAVRKGSLVLGPDVVDRLPPRPQGQTLVVIDACRTDLRTPDKAGGLNQVVAPAGCLIAFSTGAGRPALAPDSETRNTFYTAALVEQLAKASDELTFSDLFGLVRISTERTMLNYPAEIVRRYVQIPFVADNTVHPLLLARRRAPQADVPPPQRFSSEDEAAEWAALQQTPWPVDVLRLAGQFQRRYPSSKLGGAVLVAQEGAQKAAKVLRSRDVTLFRSAFNPDAMASEALKDDLLRAARGDKDAAARIGHSLNTRARTGRAVTRFEGWMQYAAELGNGIASYDLALHYRQMGQPQPAARWEEQARLLGYVAPLSLGSVRK